MFSLFSGKLSSVLTTAFQGLTSAVGKIVDAVVTAAETITDVVVETVVTPTVEALHHVPVLGDVVGSVTGLVGSTTDNLFGTLHNTANNIESGNLATTLGGLATDTSNLLGSLAVDTASTLDHVSTTLINAAQDFPIIGEVVETASTLVSSAANNLVGTVHHLSENLQSGDVVGAVKDLLSDATFVAGNLVTDTTFVVDELLDSTSLITNTLAQVPVLGGVLNGVVASVDNVVDTVGGVGQYVADVNPVDLVSDLLHAPAQTVGNVVIDVSKVVSNVSEDLNPLVTSTASTPLVGAVVETGKNAVDLVAGTVAAVGTGLHGFNALDELFNHTASSV